MLSEDVEVSADRLLNRIGLTDVGEVRANFGRALVRIDSYEHSVEVRCREGVIAPRGVAIKLVEYEPQGNFFWVVRAETEAAS